MSKAFDSIAKCHFNEVLSTNFLLHTDQTRNLVLAVLFDDFDTGMGVAPAPIRITLGLVIMFLRSTS